MFGKVIVFGLFEMILKKKSEDCVPESEFGLRVESGTAARAVTINSRPTLSPPNSCHLRLHRPLWKWKNSSSQAMGMI